MAQLVRKEITLTAEDAAALERVARELGVSESTVLRKSIRSLLEDHENAQRTSALQRLFALAEQYAGGITPADSARAAPLDPRRVVRPDLPSRRRADAVF